MDKVLRDYCLCLNEGRYVVRGCDVGVEGKREQRYLGNNFIFLYGYVFI